MQATATVISSKALLIRRLLADGVPVRRMPELVSGSGDELKRMILGGVEMVLRPEGGGEAEPQPNRYQQSLRACAEKSVSGWLRVALGEGIEIHLSDKRPKMTPEQRRQMAAMLDGEAAYLAKKRAKVAAQMLESAADFFAMKTTGQHHRAVLWRHEDSGSAGGLMGVVYLR